ncbi:GbsR/MarR family transcriptional regulator [Halobacterium bonnevillei]|uniref:HTH-type transcriptional regulator n=1 Tax=Halobacterium bonnevillei TaxID=2692200 RepID=A0A6B0SKZ3_9EURY|nr:transcriptional regulator [Halobacterium bonnevillei]MXR22398.1 transcriptional regulator [Halobacterium bonnevillei]
MSETDVDAARERVIEGFERSAEIYGLSRSYGRLYGILFFAHDPMSLDDLAADSGFAKSTVSTAMSELERFHMVHRRSLPGEGKRAFFEAERDFWRIVQELLDREVRREIDTMTRALDDAEAALETADTERARTDLERIRDLQRVYAQSERLVDLATSASADRLRTALSTLSETLRR